MERILIKQDDNLLANICSDLGRFRATFKHVLDAYKQLEIGDFTEEIFDQIISGNSSAITNKYKKSLDEHLDNTLVKNSTLKRIVLQGTEETISSFLRASREFVNTDTTPEKWGLHKDRGIFLSVKDISFNNGELFVSDKSKERLLEAHCRLYVETENDHKIHSALLKMQPALQEFREALFDLGLPMNIYDMLGGPGYITDHYIKDFFSCQADKKVMIKPEAIKWAANYKAEQARMIAMNNRLR